MTATNYVEEWRLNWIRGTAAPAAPAVLYLGASRADPGEDGSGLDEPDAGDGYGRIAVVFGVPAARSMATAVEHLFAQATAAWGTITHWTLHDAAAGGNVLARVALGTPEVVAAGNRLTYPTGSTISISGNVFEYLAHLWLNWYRGIDMPAAPAAVYGGLSLTPPNADGTNITEPSGGYARQEMAFDAPVQGANAATIANSDAEQWGQASADWGSFDHGTLHDAAAAGNPLAWGVLPATQTINSGGTADAPAGAIVLGAS